MWSRHSAQDAHGVLKLHTQHREALTGPDAAAADYLAGVAAAELDDHRRATQLLRAAADGQAEDRLLAKALYQLAQSRQQLDDAQGMDDAVTELTNRFPQSPLRVDAAFLTASADVARGDITTGAAKLTDFITAGPEHPYYRAALLRRARLYEAAQKPEQAVADYDRFLAAPPSDPDTAAASTLETRLAVELRLLALRTVTGQAKQAQQDAQQLLDTQTLTAAQRQEVMLRLAEAYRVLQQRDQALATLDTLDNDFPLHAFQSRTQWLRGMLLMSSDNPEQAVPRLVAAAADETLPTDRRVDALRVLAAFDLASHQTPRAQRSLLQIVSLSGIEALQPAERVALAETLLDSGSPAPAITYLQGLTDHDTLGERAAMRLGTALRRTGQLDAARDTLLGVVARSVRYGAEARLELAQTFADAGSPREALAELRGLTDDPQNPRLAAEALIQTGAIHLALARQAAQDDQPKRAEDQLAEARRSYRFVTLVYDADALAPLTSRAYLGLADVEKQAGQSDAAKQALTQLIEKFPGSLYTDFAAATLAAQAGKKREARDVFNRLRQDPALPPDLQKRLAPTRD